jgi:hypothetical protein
MAEKNVSVDLTSNLVGREESGVTFTVKSGDGKFGELIVSKGGIRWKPKRKQDHRHMSWENLDKAIRAFPKR